MWNDIPESNLQQEYNELKKFIEEGFKTESNINFDNEYEKLFGMWQKEFHKDYNNEEMEYRIEVFK